LGAGDSGVGFQSGVEPDKTRSSERSLTGDFHLRAFLSWPEFDMTATQLDMVGSRSKPKVRCRHKPRHTVGWLLRALAALWLGIVAAASGNALQPLEIDGDLPAPVMDQLRIAASLEPADRSAATITRDLLRILRSEGFYGAAVRIERRDASPSFIISPGRRFSLAQLEAATTPEDLRAAHVARDAISLQVGDPLRAEAVIASEALALSALQERGWPDADALDRHVVVDHTNAQGQITYNFAAGPYTEYGAVQFSDSRWRPPFIERLALLPSGEPAKVSGLRAYQERLTSLGGVAQASVRLADPQPGTAQRDIIVQLTPAARHVIEAGLSFSTSEGGGVGGAWTRRNLLGGDEALRLFAKVSTLEQSVEARLAAPHFRRLDQTLTLLGTIRNEETDAFDQQAIEAEVDLTRRFNPVWSGGVHLGAELSHLTASSIELDTVSILTGVFAIYDTRDSVTDPSRGWRARASIAPITTFGDLRSGYVIAEASMRTYRRMSDHLILAGRARFGGLLGANLASVPIDQRFFAGGGGSVRGFEFQSLGPQSSIGEPTGGRSVVESSLELRWRGNGRWGAAAFIDAGIASPNASPEVGDLRAGAGVGVRYHFGFAPIRLDIAAPLDRRSDEASLHVYVGLGQAF
jgi:translocation and assembly module TamA